MSERSYQGATSRSLMKFTRQHKRATYSWIVPVCSLSPECCGGHRSQRDPQAAANEQQHSVFVVRGNDGVRTHRPPNSCR